MRYVRYAILAIIAIALITLALANRDAVAVSLLPAEMSRLIGFELFVQVPLFVVIFGSVIAGILLGFVWEWMREHKHRSAATSHRREKQKLEREVSKLKTDKAKSEGDEVLALLEH